jgi:hypothetical protein
MSLDQVAGGAFSSAPITPSRRLSPTQVGPRRWPVRGLLLLAACGLAGLILAGSRRESTVGPSVSTSVSYSRFVANEQLSPMISFSQLEGIRGPSHYQARVRETGSERWDTLTFGDAEADGFLFRVTLRSANPTSVRSSLFVELAKQSAEIGSAITHATSPQPYATERGPIEWAGITLSGGSVERLCLGFRLARTGDMDLSGLACGGHGLPLDVVGLGCLVDRLSATTAGLESGLGEIFRRDAAQGAVCSRVLG